MTNPTTPPAPPDAAKLTEIQQQPEQYVLRLYVTGTTPRSMRAISNIRKICEEHLEGHYDLEVVDICAHPVLAEGEQIIAAPTLIKTLPLPMRRFIGDLSQTDRILLGLDLLGASSAASSPRP